MRSGCHKNCCILVAPLKLRVKLLVKRVSSPVSVLQHTRLSIPPLTTADSLV